MNKENRDILVNTIKEVHEKLRKSFHQTQNLNKVWQDHIQEDIDLRKRYSTAMKKLATEFWNGKECRIEWSYQTCMEYFKCGGLEKSLLREKRKKLFNLKSNQKPEFSIISSINKDCQILNQKLKLLDVGSCYNPFSKYSEFSSVAIDLTPATNDVLQCDFLNLIITNKSNTKVVDCNLSLIEESFDTVILSLVLEYLPSSEQRIIFCLKSWQLLKLNGLCIIITPDSKSSNYNAQMIKSWKLAIEKIGFIRVRYDKLSHLHCMAFRKSSLSSEYNVTSCKSLANLMYIPQDFKTYEQDSQTIERTPEENHVVWQQFLELPTDFLTDSHN